MAKLTKKDIKEINRLRSLFPKLVKVQVDRSNDGGFCAEVKTFPGCFTEANTFSELIEMVNDAVNTYLDIPRKFQPYTPTYIPPVDVAKKLDIFPVREKSSSIEFVIPNREKVTR